MSNIVVVTNNDVVRDRYADVFKIDFLESATLLETLVYTRNLIHSGHKLLTHPLSGSIKPNDTPYKTIVVSKQCEELDFKGLCVIEESITATEKFIRGRQTPMWNNKVKSDFKLIDSTIIATAIESMDGKFIG